MHKLNVLIVDDEPMAQKILEIYCEKLQSIEIVAICNNAIEAMSYIQNTKIDLIFIDINMPEITGVDFVKSIKSPASIVFTTAYSEYAVESYNLSALDYLLKPISFERFLTTVNKASKIHQKNLAVPETLVDDRILIKDNSIFVKSNGKRVRIELNNLLYVEGLKDYVKLCLGEEKIIVHGSLKKIETYISRHKIFVRVHKSYIVNTTKIKEFDRDEIKLQVDNIVIPIGQTYYNDLEQAISGKKY